MPLRFGLIGCGEIGKLRAAALARLGPNRLVAVCDADGARVSALAAASRCAAEQDWRVLASRSDVDAVIVSTPPHLHAEMAVAALENGKHVLCEKPLARDSTECRRMIAAAAKAGRTLATGFNYRFYPSVEKARALLDSGIIGELDHIRSYAGYSATAHHQAWLHDVSIMGGGALRDNGIHLIDLTRWFLGEVAEASGRASNAVWGFPGCEDNGFLHLRGVNGRIAALQASWTEWAGYRFEINIYGSLGAIRLRCFPMITEVVASATRGGTTGKQVWRFPYVHLMEHLRSYRWVVIESFVKEFHAFDRAISGQPSALATGVDGLRTIELAEAAILV